MTQNLCEKCAFEQVQYLENHPLVRVVAAMALKFSVSCNETTNPVGHCVGCGRKAKLVAAIDYEEKNGKAN